MRFRCLLWSITSAAPTVCPHCELPAPRGSSGTREFAADVEGRAHVVVGLRDQHADGLDLVDRRVGGVAAARRAVEQHVALDGAVAGAARGRRARRSGNQNG